MALLFNQRDPRSNSAYRKELLLTVKKHLKPEPLLERIRERAAEKYTSALI
jgi:hypothetical protein